MFRRSSKLHLKVKEENDERCCDSRAGSRVRFSGGTQAASAPQPLGPLPTTLCASCSSRPRDTEAETLGSVGMGSTGMGSTGMGSMETGSAGMGSARMGSGGPALHPHRWPHGARLVHGCSGAAGYAQGEDCPSQFWHAVLKTTTVFLQAGSCRAKPPACHIPQVPVREPGCVLGRLRVPGVGSSPKPHPLAPKARAGEATPAGGCRRCTKRCRRRQELSHQAQPLCTQTAPIVGAAHARTGTELPKKKKQSQRVPVTAAPCSNLLRPFCRTPRSSSSKYSQL